MGYSTEKVRKQEKLRMPNKKQGRETVEYLKDRDRMLGEAYTKLSTGAKKAIVEGAIEPEKAYAILPAETQRAMAKAETEISKPQLKVPSKEFQQQLKIRSLARDRPDGGFRDIVEETERRTRGQPQDTFGGALEQTKAMQGSELSHTDYAMRGACDTGNLQGGKGFAKLDGTPIPRF